MGLADPAEPADPEFPAGSADLVVPADRAAASLAYLLPVGLAST
jgi:hypothetical protein